MGEASDRLKVNKQKEITAAEISQTMYTQQQATRYQLFSHPPSQPSAPSLLWPLDSLWHVVTAPGRYHSDRPPQAGGMVLTLLCWRRGSALVRWGWSCDTITLINILDCPPGLLDDLAGQINEVSLLDLFLHTVSTRDTNDNWNVYYLFTCCTVAV